MRIWISATCRSKCRAINDWPSSFIQCILVSTRLRRWYPLQRRHRVRPRYRCALTASLRAIAPALVGFQGFAFLRGGTTAWASLSARRPILGLVLRRGPTAHSTHLSRWIHTVNPISPFMQQSPNDLLMCSEPEETNGTNGPDRPLSLYLACCGAARHYGRSLQTQNELIGAFTVCEPISRSQE
jgi:hypothetical protein